MPARIGERFLPRLRRTVRGRNIVTNLFELWVGFAGLVSGIVFFWQPGSLDGNALARTIGYTWSTVWVLSYMAAGALIFWGLLRPSPRWEVVALWILGTATLTEGLGITDVFGLRGSPVSSELFALTLASWGRAIVIQTDVVRLVRTLPPETDGDG